jgi:hypothetical protein
MKIKIFFLIIFAVFFEYLRDYLFVNTNLQIVFLENTNNDLNVSNYTDSLLLKFFKNIDISSLTQLKWIMSLIFSLVFFGLGFFFSKWSFELSKHKKFLKSFIIGGCLILFSSLIIYYIGNLLSVENKFNFYYVSLELSHFVQSSLYPISFLLVFFANNRTKISA